MGRSAWSRRPGPAAPGGARSAVWYLVIVLVSLLPAIPEPSGAQPPASSDPAEKKTRGASPIDVIVDGKLVRTWGSDELIKLATAKVPNRMGLDVEAIPLTALIFFEDSGVTPEKVARVTIRGRRKRQQVVLEGTQLAALSQVYIATSRAAFRRPWRVAVEDPEALELGGNALGLHTIEVVSKEAPK